MLICDVSVMCIYNFSISIRGENYDARIQVFFKEKIKHYTIIVI